MKILILTANDPDKKCGWENTLNEIGDGNNVQIGCIYKKQCGLIKRALRKLHRYLPIPGYQIWFDDWWDELKDIDAIIAIAYDSTYRIFKMIKRKYPHIRKILYWWDPSQKTISPDKVSESICERWTFSRQDASRFGIRYNSQFYAHDENRFSDTQFKNFKYDVMFFGSGGGKLYQHRIKLLKDFHQVCVLHGLKTCFGILYRSKRDRIGMPFALDKCVDEVEYKKIVMESKAMLDLTEPGQEWLTLRPVEALWLGKKLITNNVTIVEDKLYDSQNIFILGKDSYEKLNDFLNSPFKKMPEEVYRYYSTHAWLQRFGLL